jgi:hypothetical protein
MSDDGIQTTDDGLRFYLFSVIRLLSAEGAIAQLGERLLCKQEVVGSIPSGSTRRRRRLQRSCKSSFVRILSGRCSALPRRPCCLTS